MKKLELAIQQAAERISNEKDRFRQIPRPCACGKPAPSSDALHHIIEGLWDVIFPLRFNQADLQAKSEKEFIAGMLKKLLPGLMEQIHRGICFFCGQDAGQDCKKCEEKAKELTEKFIGTLPKIQMMVAGDVKAHYEGDPAATCLEEMILCYPGVLAVTCYRIAHQLLKLGVPLIPRMMTELAHSKTGIDIHPGAVIGENFFVDHGTGVVIGETSVIGNNVVLYQGVTLGAKSFPVDKDGKPIKGVDRHPIVEDNVVIYSEATILGRITIGKGSTIGGNVWLTHDVPPGSKVMQHTKGSLKGVK